MAARMLRPIPLGILDTLSFRSPVGVDFDPNGLPDYEVIILDSPLAA
jgi:hypothetical protein